MATPPSDMQQQIHTLLKEKYIKSWFTWWAEAWGEKPWWLKALFLMFISLVTVVPAIVFQIWPLFFATGIFAVLYIGVSLLLDNHYDNEVARFEKNGEKSQSILNIFTTIMQCLNRSAMTLETQSLVMVEHNDDLGNEIQHFSDINQSIEQNSQRLDTVVTDLDEDHQTIVHNNQDIQTTLKNYQQHQDKCEAIHQERISKTQNEVEALKQQVEQLQKINTCLQMEKNHTKTINLTLVKTMGDLVCTHKTQQNQVEKFQSTLDTILDNAKQQYEENIEKLQKESIRFEQATNKMTQQVQIMTKLNEPSFDKQRLFSQHPTCKEPFKRQSIHEVVLVN